MKPIFLVLLFTLSVVLSPFAVDACAGGEYGSEQVRQDQGKASDDGHVSACHHCCHQHVAGLSTNTQGIGLAYSVPPVFSLPGGDLVLSAGPSPLLEPPSHV